MSGPTRDPDVAPEPAAPEHVRRAQAERLLRAWALPTGWRYWSAVNNEAVGLWYTSACFTFLAFAGVLALIMRVQLAQPGQEVVSADTYNQLFTVHGSVMMFLFAIPIFEAIAVLLLPQFRRAAAGSCIRR
jgi:cytochrome c oxidase subunit I+III